MTTSTFLEDYFDLYKDALADTAVYAQIDAFVALLQETQAKGGKVIFAGNGGSAAMASHTSVDLTKNAGIRSINFNEADLITCFANDYGYERWMEKALEFYADADKDAVVLISSSGKSPNVVAAGKYCNAQNMPLVTFTGFDETNPLKQLGQLNFFVKSKGYNVVEMVHHIWMLAAVDAIIGAVEYSA
ncbi:MAG: SIS domain-containing protein [bacterium]|nr:SIS domain-containing protein [bacterium]